MVKDLASFRRLALSPNELEQYALSEGDIVLNRVNSMEYLGKCAVMPRFDERVVFESNMMRLRTSPTLADPEYVAQHLQAPATRSALLQKAKRAVNQASVNQGDVQSLPLMLPPLKLQRGFAQYARGVRAIVSQQQESGRRLSSLFAYFLELAFSGRLTARWRETHMTEIQHEMEDQQHSIDEITHPAIAALPARPADG